MNGRAQGLLGSGSSRYDPELCGPKAYALFFSSPRPHFPALFYWGKTEQKIYLFTHLSVQFSGIKDIHIAV